jgi:small conductance mechanosensitive channel
METSQIMDPKILETVVWPTLMLYVPRIIGLLLALWAARILSNWTGRLVKRSLANRDEVLQKFLSSLVRYTVLVVCIVAALGYVGVETASFAAILAASGLAIGLAFQGTLSNFSSGVMLLIFRPFKVDDYVEVGGESGVVVGMELFTTELKSLDNKRIIMPNSAIFGSNITNFAHHPIRRVDVPVGTEYSADVDKTREVLETVPKDITGVIADPPPQIFLAGLGASSVDWQVRVWCNTPDYWDVYQAVTAQTKKTLDGAGIGIPFPQHDLHLDKEVVRVLGNRRLEQTRS